MAQSKIYKIIAIKELFDNPTLLRSHGSEIRREPYLPAVMVPIPRIEFGQIDPPAFSYTEFPDGSWHDKEYGVLDGFLYTIDNAVVHGEVGVVTVGQYLIQETLYHAFPQAWGMEYLDDDRMSIPDAPPSLRVRSAAHALGGAGGSRNYGHWLSNNVPAIQIAPFGTAFQNCVLLMPNLVREWQKLTLDLIPEVSEKAVFLEEKTVVHCESLKFIPRILWSDYTPHPSRREMICEIVRRASRPVSVGPRIFISRADSPIRKLANEAELIDIASKYDFEPLTLSGRSVADQISIFANASHIISPHGAGLGNVIFCKEAASLLELHKATTVQWSIRRAAAVPKLRYGCLIGQDLRSQDDVNIHDRAWSLSPDIFIQCLKASSFLD